MRRASVAANDAYHVSLPSASAVSFHSDAWADVIDKQTIVEKIHEKYRQAFRIPRLAISMALFFQKTVLLKKYQDMLIERPGIFQATGVPGAVNHAMLRAGDARAHFFAALERIVELAVHDQHRHLELRQSRRQIAILQCVEYLGDGGC